MGITNEHLEKLKNQFTAIGDRVIIYPDPKTERTSGGIFIPDSAQQEVNYGTIIAAGKGILTMDGKFVPLTVKVGDRVLFPKYTGFRMEYNGVDYVSLKEGDLLSIIHENEETKE